MRSIAIVASALIACGGARRPPPGEEYVKQIRLHGNRALTSKTLVAGLAFDRARKNGKPPDPYLVQVDADG